jgi:hypothetical protein
LRPPGSRSFKDTQHDNRGHASPLAARRPSCTAFNDTPARWLGTSGRSDNQQPARSAPSTTPRHDDRGHRRQRLGHHGLAAPSTTPRQDGRGHGTAALKPPTSSLPFNDTPARWPGTQPTSNAAGSAAATSFNDTPARWPGTLAMVQKYTKAVSRLQRHPGTMAGDIGAALDVQRRHPDPPSTTPRHDGPGQLALAACAPGQLYSLQRHPGTMARDTAPSYLTDISGV